MPASLASRTANQAQATLTGQPAAASALRNALETIFGTVLASRASPLALIALVALASRLRYITSYDGAYGSGDAHLVLTRALFISRGQFEPPATLGAPAGVFTDPPLIPLLLAGFSKATTIPVEYTPLILGPIIAVAGLLALYGVLCRAFDPTVALASTLVVALLPRFAFDSTEPDKVTYVVAFYVIALFFLYEGQRRPPWLVAAGLFMGLSVFSHTTALLFVPAYFLSHIALSRARWHRIFEKYFLLSSVIVVAFFAAYVLLDDQSHPSVIYTGNAVSGAPVPETTTDPRLIPSTQSPLDTLAPEESGTRFVPGQIERYWLVLRDLAERGFRDSAWNDYFDGIRDQVLDPVYAFAIAGFAVSAWLAISRRRGEAIPLLLWMSTVTVGFAIQHPAASHFTRYPSYVTPVYVVMAVFLALWLARAVATRFEMQPAYGVALAVPFLAYATFAYATAPEPGIRKLYEPHHQIADFVHENGLLATDDRLLYLGWPSYTFHLLASGADANALQTFGWQQVSFSNYDFEGRRIRYYAYDDRNDDYFGNGKRMLGQIGQAYDFRVVVSYCMAPSPSGDEEACAGHVTLFEITRKPGT